jgi:methanogenic corrinoid protein MtbC1
MRQSNDDDGRVSPAEGAFEVGDDRIPARSVGNPGSVEALARAAIGRLAAEAARRSGPGVEPAPEGVIDAFCSLLVAGEYAAAEAMLRRLTVHRQNYAQIADGLLSQAARRLGRGWEEDTLSFADVSVAVAHIFRLNQAFRQRNVPLVRGGETMGLFATIPGQPHNLGLVLAAEAFRGEGWKVDLRLDTPAREIIDLAQRVRPKLIGLTISREDKRHQLAHLIISLRALPVPLRIMLGGRGAHNLARILPRGHIDRVVTDIASALKEA